jgi:hypothetical protein
MNAAVILVLLGIISFGMGLVAAVLSRRYGVVLTVGTLVVLSLYLLYVLNVGEGAPFVPYVMAWGVAWASVALAGLALGVGVGRMTSREARLS